MSSHEFYQSHLNRVSRSFAHCIERLEGQLRGWIGLTYLVCRILDTVEDAPWSKTTQQVANFKKFDNLLSRAESAPDAQSWDLEFPAEITDGEKELLSASRQIFQDLHKFPSKVKQIIQDMVGSMSAGMQYFAAQKVNGQLRLENMEQVNQYCFFVAGVVGETLTKLIRADVESHGGKIPSILDAHHFGLFLQKVNILKDQSGDEKDGRFFIPSREEVYLSLSKNADGAFQYFQCLPIHMKSYRMFCASSFFLGLACLPFIEKTFTSKEPIKIPRDKTAQLFKWIEKHIDQPEKFEMLYKSLMQQTRLTVDALPALQSPGTESQNIWWSQVYRGELENSHFVDLGLLEA